MCSIGRRRLHLVCLAFTLASLCSAVLTGPLHAQANDDRPNILWLSTEDHDEWILETRDTGFLQEAEMMLRAEGSTPYEVAQDPDQYDLPRIRAAAELVGDESVSVSVLGGMLSDEDSGVRYWAAEALLARVEEDAWKVRGALEKAMSDTSPIVQITSAETMCRLRWCDEALDVLAGYLNDDREWLALQAAISVRQLGERAEPIAEAIRRTRAKYSGEVDVRGYRDWGYTMFIGFALNEALETLGRERDF